jgi:hypothetical protein
LLLCEIIEFPAKYGVELWERLREEVKMLSAYITKELSPYYKTGIGGYNSLYGGYSHKILYTGYNKPHFLHNPETHSVVIQLQTFNYGT